jgi:hypothetical protein
MTTVLDRVIMLELQAALRAGAGPAEALSAVACAGVLDGAARELRLGRSLTQIATAASTGDPAADFLLRSLALTERSGGGGAEAVEHALDAIRAEADVQRLLGVRTTQARGTAVILAAVPVAAWLLLVLLDPRMLRFYATPVGWFTGGLAVVLATAAWRWMRRMTAATTAAAAAADPLRGEPPAPAWRRGLALGAVAAALLGALLGPVPALLGAVAAGFAAARRREVASTGGGGAETVSLLAVALGAGMALPTAFAEVAAVAPTAAQPLLQSAARRLAGGWRCDEALAGTPLAPVGATLAATQRWGAPAVPALRALADDLRADRRAAVEAAAERLQLTLIFPTTLLTLPAFVLGVVPPLLWVTVRG